MKKTTEGTSRKGFTLIELIVIVIIVGILAVVGQVVFKKYIKTAIITEGRALMSTILTAQKTYYVEYMQFYQRPNLLNDWTSQDEVLGIDARSNKYFTLFTPSNKNEPSGAGAVTAFVAYAPMPEKAFYDGKTMLRMQFDVGQGYVSANNTVYEQIL